jgi:hypothetical protein
MTQHQQEVRGPPGCDSFFPIGICSFFDIGQHPDVGLAPMTLTVSGISRITDRAAFHKKILRLWVSGYRLWIQAIL